MLQKRARTKLLDKAHRIGVYSCMALTLYGASLCAYNFYCYLTYTKPELHVKREALKKELLLEGEVHSRS